MTPLPLAQPATAQPRQSQVNAPSSKSASEQAINQLKRQSSKVARTNSLLDQSFIVLAAAGLVLFALASNVGIIMDLCCGGLLINEHLVRSPLGIVDLEHNYHIGLYAITTLLSVICGIALTRYDLPRWAEIIKYVPIIYPVVFIGIVLRKSGPIAQKIAYFYLIAGSMLAGLAIMYFYKNGFHLDQYSWYPILYSTCLQSGLILAIASAMTLESEPAA